MNEDEKTTASAQGMTWIPDSPSSIAPARSETIASMTDQASALGALRDAFNSRVVGGDITDLKSASAYINTWADAAFEVAFQAERRGGDSDA